MLVEPTLHSPTTGRSLHLDGGKAVAALTCSSRCSSRRPQMRRLRCASQWTPHRVHSCLPPPAQSSPGPCQRCASQVQTLQRHMPQGVRQWAGRMTRAEPCDQGPSGISMLCWTLQHTCCRVSGTGSADQHTARPSALCQGLRPNNHLARCCRETDCRASGSRQERMTCSGAHTGVPKAWPHLLLCMVHLPLYRTDHVGRSSVATVGGLTCLHAAFYMLQGCWRHRCTRSTAAWLAHPGQCAP